MLTWTIIVLVLAVIGLCVNYLFKVPIQVSLDEIVLFLVALGILVRIRFKTKEGEKERLKQTIDELSTKKKKKKKK